MTTHTYVKKQILDNGFTILVRELNHVPKVAFQMWYNVGSKDELLGEKGIAHLIEHMIFKGTTLLSESDIDAVVRKLSGTCNAFTYYDYTGYLFNVPSYHWRELFPIVASCMTECSFKEEMLNSEIKTVIQELKLSCDNYGRSLLKEQISTIFADHPYHYPVLGYKHDLWSVSTRDLYTFYKKHYKPHNATLVVVGDIGADDVFELAEHHIGHIQQDVCYAKKEHFFRQDISATSVTLYRDVQQSIIHYMIVVPGARHKQEAILSILEWVIGKGKNSRLYRKLVNEYQLATTISTGCWNLVDHGIFFIVINPKNNICIKEIEKIVRAEFDQLAHCGIGDHEVERGYKNARMLYQHLFDNFEYQASSIAQSFLATGDEEYIFNQFTEPLVGFKQKINDLLRQCFRSIALHTGYILPLPESEKVEWRLLQAESDREDVAILTARVRSAVIEPPSYAREIVVKTPPPFIFPRPYYYTLSNGLKVVYYPNMATATITLLLEFGASPYSDPDNKQGLYRFVARMMTEGTRNYNYETFSEVLESRGMSVDVQSSGITITMLPDDFEYGLTLLVELVVHATFPEASIEKVRKQMMCDVKQYWDDPLSFVTQLVKEELYKNHPYSKQVLGTQESLQSIIHEDIVSLYKRYISPNGSRMAVVGNIGAIDMPTVLEKKLSLWKPIVREHAVFPMLMSSEPKIINYPINRDQVVLSLAKISINRQDPDFDLYILCDQIFGGGVSGSMCSRLFKLREETGLFYTSKGSLLAGSDEQAGMFLITTTVSLDRLIEAEIAIKKTIDMFIDTVTKEEVQEAKRAVIASCIDHCISNNSLAKSFLFLERYKLSTDYFDTYLGRLNTVTLEDIKRVGKKLFNSNDLVTVRVGRVV